MTTNPGKDAPIPRCGKRCGLQVTMAAFDALPRSLRNFYNNEARIQWCMCRALEEFRCVGEVETLARYREAERKYR
jgi:hypothetical protein